MREFNAHLTLFESAQVFHFRRICGVYAANVSGRAVTEKDTDAFSESYFDLKRDYACVLSHPEPAGLLKRCVQAFCGLRVLNQPAWEATLAFILSANNNVSRIRNLVNELNLAYGDYVEYNGERLYGFPRPEVLARVDEATLRERVRCGYRAKYLIETARLVSQGFPLEALRHCSCGEARKKLMSLPGVGGKVADCICLFGLGHADAFPVDVWVKRLMESRFGIKGSPERVREEAKKILGDSCGILQQYLFHAARTGLIDL